MPLKHDLDFLFTHTPMSPISFRVFWNLYVIQLDSYCQRRNWPRISHQLNVDDDHQIQDYMRLLDILSNEITSVEQLYNEVADIVVKTPK